MAGGEQSQQRDSRCELRWDVEPARFERGREGATARHSRPRQEEEAY